MFGKTKEENGKTKEDNDRVPPPVQQFQRLAAMHTEEQTSNDQVSSINRGMTVVGKVFGKGTLHISGRIEGELQALSVLIDEGAQVEGDIVRRTVDYRWRSQRDDSCKSSEVEQYCCG